MTGLEQIIIAVMTGLNTLVLGILALLLKLQPREHGMSQEERDLLIEIRTRVQAIEKGIDQDREGLQALERRHNEHLKRHR